MSERGICQMCGSAVPKGQRDLCSMCMGDIDYGRDGYYRGWMERDEARQEQEQEQEKEPTDA